jgi:hypothetical protein
MTTESLPAPPADPVVAGRPSAGRVTSLDTDTAILVASRLLLLHGLLAALEFVAAIPFGKPSLGVSLLFLLAAPRVRDLRPGWYRFATFWLLLQVSSVSTVAVVLGLRGEPLVRNMQVLGMPSDAVPRAIVVYSMLASLPLSLWTLWLLLRPDVRTRFDTLSSPGVSIQPGRGRLHTLFRDPTSAVLHALALLIAVAIGTVAYLSFGDEPRETNWPRGSYTRVDTLTERFRATIGSSPRLYGSCGAKHAYVQFDDASILRMSSAPIAAGASNPAVLQSVRRGAAALVAQVLYSDPTRTWDTVTVTLVTSATRTSTGYYMGAGYTFVADSVGMRPVRTRDTPFCQ